jgi:hypothetical protein
MRVKTTGGATTFLFESPWEAHQQYMQKTATGVRGKAYEITPKGTDLPDPVAAYALANVPNVVEAPPEPSVVEVPPEPSLPEPAKPKRRKWSKA